MRKYNSEEFIKKAVEKHNNKYDYSKVKYVNSQTKVCIICPEHGEFWQTPANHLYKTTCPKCSIKEVHDKQKSNKEEFIKKAKEIHGDKYDYSKVEYVNNKTKVCIICHEKDEFGNEHGEFWQRPDAHLSKKHGCQKCGSTCKLTTEYFIKKAKKIHDNKYDYSKVVYSNNRKKMCMICPIHGEFWQTPHAHLSGQGCPSCLQRKLEKEINDFLVENKINYIFQKRFKWLGNKSLDFYLPDYNIAIECQGIQHFEPVEFFGGVNMLKKQIKNDLIKKELCEQHNITLLYYTHKKKNLINNVYELKEILDGYENI